MCWWLSGGSELVALVRQAQGEWVKELDGSVCWWMSGRSELVALVRQAEGEWNMELDGWV